MHTEVASCSVGSSRFVVLVPLAVIIIAFAVANRQVVTVSFDPFNANAPAAAVTLPLFALVILLLIIGVLIGGLAVWLRQGRWRQAARRLERELQHLRGKVAALEGAASRAHRSCRKRASLRRACGCGRRSGRNRRLGARQGSRGDVEPRRRNRRCH